MRELIAKNPRLTPRYELVDGELLVTPSPSFSHQAVVTQLIIELGTYLEQQKVGNVYASPSDVELEPEFVSQPDVFVVSRAENRRLWKDALPVRELLLAIEVLSPGSSRHDRVRKRPMYQRHVPLYWIVDFETRSVDVWRPRTVQPEISTKTVTWSPKGVGEPLVLNLPVFFARMAEG